MQHIRCTSLQSGYGKWDALGEPLESSELRLNNTFRNRSLKVCIQSSFRSLKQRHYVSARVCTARALRQAKHIDGGTGVREDDESMNEPFFNHII